MKKPRMRPRRVCVAATGDGADSAVCLLRKLLANDWRVLLLPFSSKPVPAVAAAFVFHCRFDPLFSAVISGYVKHPKVSLLFGWGVALKKREVSCMRTNNKWKELPS